MFCDIISENAGYSVIRVFPHLQNDWKSNKTLSSTKDEEEKNICRSGSATSCDSQGFARRLTSDHAAMCAQTRKEFRADFHLKDKGCISWEQLVQWHSFQSDTKVSCLQQWCWVACGSRREIKSFAFSSSPFPIHLLFGCKMRLHRGLIGLLLHKLFLINTFRFFFTFYEL